MNRPNKDFPNWNPHRVTKNKFHSDDYKTRLVALRNSSSAFIKRKDVRAYIFERDEYQCCVCGSKNNIQVDHIVSIYQCAKGIFPVYKLNKEDNLQTLCKTCNSSKKP